MPLLSASGLAFARDGRALAAGLALEVRAGDRWGLIGPNGCGKSTLLHVLAGLRAPACGEVRLAGSSYGDLGPREAARRRALLLQGTSYAFGASVHSCVLLGRHPHMGRFDTPDAADLRHVEEALRVMDLDAVAARDVLRLSGGERQRTRIAAVLAQDPLVYLLDEPTTHLDPSHQSALFRRLQMLCETRDRAVVFSTHDFPLASRFATHALVCAGQGRWLAGAATELLRADVLSRAFDFPIDGPGLGVVAALLPRW